MTRRKLTPAQRRVLRRMAISDDMIAAGHVFELDRQFRGDRQIERKLVRRGFAVYEMRSHGYGYNWRVWLTQKGRAALDGGR